MENPEASEETLELLENEGHFEQTLKASLLGYKPMIQVDLTNSDSRVRAFQVETNFKSKPSPHSLLQACDLKPQAQMLLKPMLQAQDRQKPKQNIYNRPQQFCRKHFRHIDSWWMAQ